MTEIKMIPIADLEHHPENPRKELGDLSELTESIKKNGIYQNLTVVPDAERLKYLVVIGNRRMEAAKAAGLTALPCVISDMDHKEQIATMLEENMQRQDLTIYEQVQGFQMMMDLGYTAKQIGEKTGFSEKTVKDRLKLTKFDQKNFAEAVNSGATLLNLVEISKLESKEDQDKAMEAVGTRNFKQVLMDLTTEQGFRKSAAYLEPIIQELGLQPFPKDGDYYRDFQGIYGEDVNADLAEEEIRRRLRDKINDNEGRQLFYKLRNRWDVSTAYAEICVRKEKTSNNKVSEEQKTERQKTMARNKKVRKVKEYWGKAFLLRRDFIRNYSISVNGTGISRIAKIFPKYALDQYVSWGTTFNHQWDKAVIMDLMGIKAEEYEDKSQTIWQMIEGRTDVPQIRAVIAWICGGGVFWPDAPEHGLYSMYDGSWQKNSNMDNGLTAMYEFLKEIGYQMSDMEIQLMDGTHPVYAED